MPAPWEKYQQQKPQSAGPWQKYASAPAQPAQTEQRSTVGEFAKGFGEAVNPIEMAKGVVTALSSPIETAKGLVRAQVATGQKAIDSARRGDYTAAVSQGINALVPVLGPAMENAITQAEGEGGNIPKFLGYAAGNAAVSAVPMALQGRRIPVSPAVRNANPTEAAAMQFLQAEGVPVSAGAMSGNAYLRAVQKMAESTPFGSLVGTRRMANQTKGLQELAGRLADEASPMPTVPMQAGEGVKTAIGGVAKQQEARANAAYDAFRQIEAQTPIMVDVKGIKAALKPIYDDMTKWWEPAKRNASAGYQAIKSIIDGADTVPASQAEAGLGGLKQLAREADGRNAGLAKFALPKLQAEIDKTVKATNPDALRFLKEGRAATAEQFTVRATLDKLRNEPVEAFGQLVYSKDAGINRLKEVQKYAPGEMRKVGRAFLDDLLQKAEAEGGFGRTERLFNDWQRMGPETKKILYPDAVLRERLDKFFLGAKKLAENPNPSGTATSTVAIGSTGLIVTEPVTGAAMALTSGALAKLLNSSRGVKLLNEGIRIPISNKAASQATALQLIRLAGEDAQPVGLTPQPMTP